jgi:hypothetical protein
MANGKKHTVEITKITCQGTSDLGDYNDEVVIIYQADAGVPLRYPIEQTYQRMNTSADPSNDVVSTWYPNLTLDFDYDALVTLWDHDDPIPSSSDYLISVDFWSDHLPTTWQMSNNNGANYTIYANVVD